jgi:hypothetical protein
VVVFLFIETVSLQNNINSNNSRTKLYNANRTEGLFIGNVTDLKRYETYFLFCSFKPKTIALQTRGLQGNCWVCFKKIKLLEKWTNP